LGSGELKPKPWRRRRLLIATTSVALIVGAAVGARLSESRAERAPTAAKASALGGTARRSLVAATTQARSQMPIPVRISIPAIGVDARIVRLGLNPDHTIQVPKNFANAGWFQPGPEPGERGAAVIVGHLDSRAGPGVFYRLHQLPVGAVIKVTVQDGRTVRFVARSMIRVPKSRFPTKRVYVHTGPPALRLVTCAGKLNWATGHHRDNYVVFATLAR
jgi:sortase (surface protein transpeptidase)